MSGLPRPFLSVFYCTHLRHNKNMSRKSRDSSPRVGGDICAWSNDATPHHLEWRAGEGCPCFTLRLSRARCVENYVHEWRRCTVSGSGNAQDGFHPHNLTRNVMRSRSRRSCDRHRVAAREVQPLFAVHTKRNHAL